MPANGLPPGAVWQAVQSPARARYWPFFTRSSFDAAGEAADDYRQWFIARLKAASTMTGDRFVCADRFTMADISFAYALLLAETLGMAESFPAKVRPYWQAMQAREGFQRAKAAQARVVE